MPELQFCNKECWEKGSASLMDQSSLFYFFRQRDGVVMPSDFGTLQGSLFYGNLSHFMLISDPKHPSFGP